MTAPQKNTRHRTGSSKQRFMERKRATFVQELVSVAGLAFVWCALWQEFDVGSVFFGVIVATLVVNVFYLPPFEVSKRINAGWLLIFCGKFLWDLVTQSFRVFWVALTKGARTRSAVIGVPLYTDADLITTLTALIISLIPGSTVLEIDRSTRSIYLHVLNVENRDEIEKSRRSVQKYEELIILVLGTRRQVATLRLENRRKRKGVHENRSGGRE